MVLWSQFLVSASEMVVNGSATDSFHLHLDKIDESWAQKLPALDYAIISAGHWFFRTNYVSEGGRFLGCIYSHDPNATYLTPDIAIQGVFRLALKSINDCNNCSRMLTLVRTFSPAHFENGAWNMGGTCNRTSPLAPEEINYNGVEWDNRNVQLAEVENAHKLGEKRGRTFDVLDVTGAMSMRPDGHPDVHWDPFWAKGTKTEKCDLSKGRWTQDARGPLYTNFSCKTLPYQRNCFLHGRMDRDFLQWRWKPDQCDLPVFNPRSFLNIVKGKTMGFIGDSLARNHMNSLLCLLSEEETPHEVYREDEEGKTIIWHLPRNNFTIMVLWSPFLVSASEMAVNGTETGGFHLHLDKIDESWVQKLPALDYAILSATNWFFRPNYVYEGGHFLGCIYCSDPNVTHLGPDIVIQGAFRLALKSINDCNSCSRIVTLLRTFSPSQFENGTWNTGGTCKRTRPFAPEEIYNGGLDLVYRNAQLAEIDNARKLGEEKGRAFDVIDVTEAMLMRPDGHPGLHWDNRWNKGLSDCLHWCLPGPVDTWNEFLLELLQRHSSFPLSSRSHAAAEIKKLLLQQ
nr:protein ALTERED XYLOGLUCAN 4-like [Coffea arabica]